MSLDGAALEKLNRAGFLQGAFLVLSSHTNVRKLTDMKFRKRLEEQQSVAARPA
jgi:hypothetical protein